MTTRDSASSYGPKPELAVNRGDQMVAGALGAFITHAANNFTEGARLDIASAYFNAGGYKLMAEALDQVKAVRFLVGTEPTPPENRLRRLGAESARPERAARNRLRDALTKQEHDLASERDLLGFSVQADATAKRLVEWLRSGNVEVRRLTDRFLHGKAFLVSDHDHGVVAGSSNFTYAGLAKNLELNLGNYSPSVVRQVTEWFDELWEAAEHYDLAKLYEARFEPHPPQLIYLRMLWELYGQEIINEANDTPGGEIHLTTFQRDGLWRARRILDEHHGVLIADEVGLGKTFLAGALIRETAHERRQNVLVVAPATLRDGPWRAFRSQYNLAMELVSYEDLLADSRLNAESDHTKLEAADIGRYAMVVVDEAHNLRNPSTKRAEALRRLLAGTPPKKLVLLTATPVNNSLWDLYYMLSYFLRNDATFADAAIPSLQGRFAEAMRMDPDDLTPRQLFDILDRVAVRRTRSFIKSYYPTDTVPINGRDTTIQFPTPRVLKVSYDLDQVMPGFFDHLAQALDPDSAARQPSGSPVDNSVANSPHAASSPPAAVKTGSTPELTLARYMPTRYRTSGTPESYELQLAGLLRSALLKRFESSPHAFANTCDRMASSHDAFLSLLEHGKVATGDALADWIATDSDDLDEVDKYLDGHLSLIDDAGAYDSAALARDVAADRDLLRDFAQEARKVTRPKDPTLAVLADELAKIATKAQSEGIGDDDQRNKRKVLIFSYFADTVEWVFEHLDQVTRTDPRLSCYKDRVAWLSGSAEQGAKSKAKVVWGFAPLTTDAPQGSHEDLYDIVVTTDVLAEGVNLQQASHIINYDLPWNPMRLVQRHGRIDRIGSPHSEVFIRCIFPDSRLDDLLNLEERLMLKLKQAAASIGVGEVLPGQAGRDQSFTETREEIERIRSEDSTIFELGGTRRGVQSGEEYRQELRRAVEQGYLEQIKAMPWGSGSGMRTTDGSGTQAGFIFCARVGDRDKPVFRFVDWHAAQAAAEADSTGAGGSDIHENADESIHAVYLAEDRAGAAGLVNDTLACLDHAKPVGGFGTARHLDDATRDMAYSAWRLARAHIKTTWNHYADKANLEPRIPKVLRDAAEVVRNHSPQDLGQDRIDEAVNKLSAPYTQRTQRAIRAALKSDDEPAEQARQVLQVIDELGLQPYQAPRPLPEITKQDVHLVCWLAIA